MHYFSFLILFFFICLAQANVERQTAQGTVKGKETSRAFEFLGIPFAQPPLRELRFKEPQPVKAWEGSRNATEYSAECAQPALSFKYTHKIEGKEDCLYLNVWIPKNTSIASLKKVLFFIPGGAFISGSSNFNIGRGNLYGGSTLAQSQNAVVVTINYRIGSLGFLNHSALSAESSRNISGNYGILDQIAALKWVQENIQNFNGDKNNVTVFGESAGAASICALLVSPLAKGLFSKVIMQSGFCAFPKMRDQEISGAAFSKKIGCESAVDPLACLRGASLTEIIAAGGDFLDLLYNLKFDPTKTQALESEPSIDGYVIPDDPIGMIESGNYNAVPAVVGTNRDEGSLFIKPASVLSCRQYRSFLREKFGDYADQVEDHYPCSGLLEKNQSEKVLTDIIFRCPSRKLLRSLAKNQTEPVYGFHFDKVSLGPIGVLGATHGSELSYVFGNLKSAANVPTPMAQRLSERMQNYWGDFAQSGNPNGQNSFQWEKYDAAKDNFIVFADKLSSDEHLRERQCEFWDSLNFL